MKALTHKPSLTDIRQAVPAKIDVQPEEVSITLALQLSTSLRYLEAHITLLPEPYSCCMLFFTVTAEGQDACVFIVRRDTLEAAWREGATRVRQWAWVRQLSAVDLRIDWPQEVSVIDSRIPWLCQLDSASAWALADEDLEYAELLPPMELSNVSQATLHTRLKTCVPVNNVPAVTPANLLLRLRGLHVDSNGVQTVLPRMPGARCTPASPIDPWQPFIPTVDMLCQQQQRDGNWLNVMGCDHLGMIYALLLAQRHVAATEPAHAMLAQAIDRAIAYPGKNTDSWLLRTDTAHIEQAMRLLVYTRYISSRQGGRDFPNLIGHTAQLAENLNSLESTASAQAKPWTSLALDAFDQCQIHVANETGQSPAFKARQAGVLPPEPIPEAFLKPPPINRQSNDDFYADGFDNQRWQSIAIAEISLLNPCHGALRDKHYLRWALAHRHFYCREVNGSSGPGWPSLAPLSREQAVLLSLAPGSDLVSNCSAAALLLLTAFSTYKLFNP
ncbi:hypothetical protein N0K08_20760 [Acidovorax sp. Be4]|uniref:Uncharacterized protein n=1 Tax=Acidovorax bellezanensis TaxID=2976702 RepID=A0ABT2PV00_9BURK|nr:hypothetical protein [Acidovorax sp. Be4]MCT9813067.1 hypothetical protein [Acidovorax sp. Be4]